MKPSTFYNQALLYIAILILAKITISNTGPGLT